MLFVVRTLIVFVSNSHCGKLVMTRVFVTRFSSVTARTALQITGLVLMTTAIIYGVEQFFQEDGAGDDGVAFADSATDNRMQWHDALYFTIVTLSTVG